MTRATVTQTNRKRRRPSLDECMDNLSLATLEANFHLPLREAAEKFGVCVTFFKKVCRAHGIGRWPHRKVAQIHKNLEKMGESPANITVEGLENIKKKEEADANGPRRRVPVWDKRRKRKLSGMAAPLEHNLPLYLCEHPDYEVYKGQDRAGFTRESRPRKMIKRERTECEELVLAPVLEPALAHGDLWIAPVPAPVSKRPTSPTSLGSSATTLSAGSSADETPAVSRSVVESIQPAVISAETLLWPDEMLQQGTQQGTVTPSGAAMSSQRDITVADLGLDAIEDKDFIKFVDSIELDSWTVPAEQSAVNTIQPPPTLVKEHRDLKQPLGDIGFSVSELLDTRFPTPWEGPPAC